LGGTELMGVAINAIWSDLHQPIPDAVLINTPLEVLKRNGTKIAISEVHITGNNNTYNIPVFKVTGAIRVLDQYAIITETTNITNLTNVHSDLWDGSVSENLTLDGVTLSAAPVGTLFTKDQDVSKAYTVLLADQGRVNEITATKELGKPFLVIQKSGADTFIRFNYTTNTVLDFKMELFFIYQELNNSALELV
jgi:2-methylaconitate cis-trans-isomerase PrpF